MRSIGTLTECLGHVAELRAPSVWAASTERITAEHQHLQALLRDPAIRAYGSNTLVGHRDDAAVVEPVAMAQEILRTHSIASPPWYDAHTARHIGYARLYSWAAGLSGVSPGLFEGVAELVVREDFQPQVPRGASYSCGDVIPASHWSRAVLGRLSRDRDYSVQPGEIMALINGNFVHTGYAVSMATKLERASVLVAEVAALFHSITCANSSNLYFVSTAERAWAANAVRYVRERADRPLATAAVQDPVSMRAIPQVLETWGAAVDDFLTETNYVLFKPSCNPFIDPRHHCPISQASFLAPTLSIKTGALTEALLFLMWAIVSWTKHLLSGRVAGIPQDGATPASPLGLIQYPKLMTAICAKSQMQLGRRIFASGAETSYGIEDLWSNGVLALSLLDEGLDDLGSMFDLALWIMCRLADDFGLEGRVESDLLDACADCDSVNDVSGRVSACLDAGHLQPLRDMFWSSPAVAAEH